VLFFGLKQLLVVFHQLLSIAAQAVPRIEVHEELEDGIFQAFCAGLTGDDTAAFLGTFKGTFLSLNMGVNR
jgi:hypothetical protein